MQTVFLTPNEILEILRQDFPPCFKKNAVKIPLSVGIHKEVFEHYKNDARLSKRAIRFALRSYTSRYSYLKILTVGNQRINLKGKVAGEVSLEQAKMAEDLLQWRQLKNRTQPPPAEVGGN